MLRRATIEDLNRLFEWRTEKTAKAVSLSTGAIEWEDHVQWLSERLILTHNESIWIAEDEDGSPYGSGRIMITDDGIGLISVVIDPAHRSRGLGTELIGSLVEKIRRMNRVPVARILRENKPSRRAFEAAGFQEVDSASDSYIEMQWH